MEVRIKGFSALSILITVFMQISFSANSSFKNSPLSCPDLRGNFLEDDFGMTIDQDSCNGVSVFGNSLFSRHQYHDLTMDGLERICYQDGSFVKFCSSTWDANSLVVRVRAGESDRFETLRISRCDLQLPNCRYGTVKAEDTLAVRDQHFTQDVLIPRHPMRLER